MGFFFKSKRTSTNLKKTKHTYASELDPVAYLSESPTSPSKSSSNTLFSESSAKKSLLDDILDTFDDKKTSSAYSSDYKTRRTSDYDFFKSDSDKNTFSSKYTSDYDSKKYTSGSSYSNNDSYKRVYKLGSDSKNDSSNKYESKYESKYTSYTTSPKTETTSNKDAYSIYTKYLQNEDKKDSLFSSTKYSSYNDRYNTGSSTNKYGSSTDNYTSKYSSTYSSSNSNDNTYSSKYTPTSTTTSSSTTTYKWTSKYSTTNNNEDERRNRFDDDRKNKFEDNKTRFEELRSRFDEKYGLNSAYDDKPEKPTWKTSLFQERSRSETRFNEIDNKGKTPAQILKELRERNLENIKKQKELNGELESEEEDKSESKNSNSETKKAIVNDSDSESESDVDVNNNDEEEDDDDDIPLNILEGGENKVENWLNGQNKKNNNNNNNNNNKIPHPPKNEIIKPTLKKKGSKASLMSNKTNSNAKNNNETNSNSSNSTSNSNSKSSKSKPEVPNSPIKEGIARSSSTGSLSRPHKPTKKASLSKLTTKPRTASKHSSLIPPVIPSPLVNQLKPIPTAIQMPVMGQQIITGPIVQPAVMVAPSIQPMMVPQFPQQFQPIFVNPGVQKPFLPIGIPTPGSTPSSSPKIKGKSTTTKKGKKKKAVKRDSVSSTKKPETPVSSPTTPVASEE